MTARALISLAATLLLISGCVTQPRVAPVPVDPAVRRALLESLPAWEARGRIAVKAPDTSGQSSSGQSSSGQGSFVWQQIGDSAVIRVSGPFGAGGYEIQWEPARLTVRSSRGVIAADYTGPGAAQRFLDEELGWSLPIDHARQWLLGLTGGITPAVETVGGDGLLLGLVQGDWRVDFNGYQSATIRPATTVELPHKLTLQSPTVRIRLVIDDWRF